MELLRTVTDDARDAATLALGVTVLGFQQAQHRAEKAQTQVGGVAKGAWHRIEPLLDGLLARVEPLVNRVRPRPASTPPTG
jgi:predicted component of type VI protein secretion system